MPDVRNPEVDTVSNIEDYSASHVNGITTISFRRPRISNDTNNDRSLNTLFYILCAWSGAAGTITRTVSYHGSTNRGVSSVQYLLPSADLCSQGILINPYAHIMWCPHLYYICLYMLYCTTHTLAKADTTIFMHWPSSVVL